MTPTDQMQIKLANYTVEDLQEFKQNLMLLNEMIHATATVINPVDIIFKQTENQGNKKN